MTTEVTAAAAAKAGLSSDEYLAIQQLLGRLPTWEELAIFSAMWSEHCSYKSSKALLRTLPTAGPQVLQGPGENAGVVEFDERLALVFKIESHNHPSALEPYQGAATGVGGILRDIFAMGARPVALLNSLRFGRVDSVRTRRLLDGVVRGIADYGNCVGVPTVGGELHFAPCYEGNPLVNVMCVGVVEKARVMRSAASGVGNLLVYYGNLTGRDGLHGATFSSAELSEDSVAERGAVQVGDPSSGKKILEATLELVKSDCCVAIQDMGAAGLTCACVELVGRGGLGAEVNLDAVPRRATGMTAFELLLSESQERMLAVVEPQNLDCAREILLKWDLEAHAIGTLDASGILRIRHDEALIAELSPRDLLERQPLLSPPAADLGEGPEFPDARQFCADGITDLRAELLEFLASPNICSRRTMWEQFDSMVQTQTLAAGNGGDAAVMRVHGSPKRYAVATDGNGLYTLLNPYEGGKLAVAEAARNVACVGAKPWAITNNLNFGNPTDPRVYRQLSEAVRGIADACGALEAPVTGGNVSLNNAGPFGAIWPTPVVGMIGMLHDDVEPIGAGFPEAELDVFLLGPVADHLGGSEWLHWKTSQPHLPCVECDLRIERGLIEVLQEGAKREILRSAHDCSVGGLAVTLAESLIASPPDIGAQITLDYIEDGRLAFLTELFAETSARVVVTATPAKAAALARLCADHGVEARLIGKTVTAAEQASEELLLEEAQAFSEGTAPIFPPRLEPQLGIRHRPAGFRVRRSDLFAAYESAGLGLH